MLINLRSRNHIHMHLGRRLSTMLHLAGALLIDLGLNMEPLATTGIIHPHTAPRTFPQDNPQFNEPTLEERRAFLGVSYLTSTSAIP
jgi:hypothetical protein